MALRAADHMVIFGITGDLAHKMTFPSLYRLEKRKLLKLPILGVAFNDWTTEQLVDMARDAIQAKEGDAFDEAVFARLAKRLDYVHGDFTDPALYDQVAERLPMNATTCFYLEIPPSLFEVVAKNLSEKGLTEDDSRVVFEKPFGTDLASAEALNAALTQYLREDQIFRIDHFLGKEPVQDLLFLRFGNALLEPLWDRYHVEAIIITMAENFGVDDRGSFYDAVGTLRDVVQNHLMQILALVGMEAPSGGTLEDRKLDFFTGIESADPAHVVRGQYTGYKRIKGVKRGSDTETYIALKLTSNVWRWHGVPIYIRAGKQLPVKATNIVVRLRKAPPVQMEKREYRGSGHDDIVLRVGDDAGISISLRVKEPGKDVARPHLVSLDFASAFAGEEVPSAYETLLEDAIQGNKSLFPSWDLIRETWRIVQPILDNPPKCVPYKVGSWGPVEADALTKRVGGWPTPLDHPVAQHQIQPQTSEESKS